MVSIKLISLLLLFAVLVDSSSVLKNTNRNFSSYWVTKYKAFFDIIDVDEDGIVTEEEYVGLTTKRAQKVLPSWRALAMNGMYSNAFRVWWSNKHTNYKTNITLEEFLQESEIDIPITIKEVPELTSDLFGTFDIDCDGKWTVDEYSKFLFVFRNAAEIQPIFDAIDQNANGFLDAEEFISAWDLYWYHQNFSTTDIIFGSRA
ncbi:sarcoplasmic calcium-binding protein-like [Lingula anatina]|uniref:Sarcoplasmic calcium-binding protein-like n=1 Tax=Lingula anatina TaxID=7574 RepID=A0A1S3I4F5_LINAN|nr:sarcoplasmic calcium-binding protein-like [Lingula anatina]|eukprot:XP_013392249.1 sarcoplasmic calcium-binding protein-like [Lingula anatina]